MFFFTYLYVYFDKVVLFFDAFIIAFVSSLIGLFLWRKYYKESFESFLVFITYFSLSSIFVYLGPVTLDRSLSSFIFMYAVQNNGINKEIYDEKYFKNYVKRRFEDGEKIGFIACEGNMCKPTLKSKILFNTIYPIGKVSNTLKKYQKFKTMVDNLNSKSNNY